MTKKTLVIITESFPFDNGEAFLENEIPFIRGFDQVYICPSQVHDFSQHRVLDSNIQIIAPDKNRAINHKLVKILRYISLLVNSQFWIELYFLLSNKKLNYRTVRALISFQSTGQAVYARVKKQLHRRGVEPADNVIFYSYWMHYHAYAAVKLKRAFSQSKAITRCHNYDLYEYRNVDNYIPFRSYILRNMDSIYPISSDGSTYLFDKYSYVREKIHLSRLGTKDYQVVEPKKTEIPIKIVSCSFLSPVKRVDRIVSALALIKDTDIEWTHFGEGILYNEIYKNATKILGKNITVNFYGAIPNALLMEKYRSNNYYLFLNVSEVEGVPVSIMEAISFGIPVIATDVGGVSEIITSGINGCLLDKEFDDFKLAETLNRFIELDYNEYNSFRNHARAIWEDKYRASKNYTDFYDRLHSL